MLACPFCDEELHTKTSDGWVCQCGEMIPFGMEKDNGENCARCSVMNCPRRKQKKTFLVGWNAKIKDVTLKVPLMEIPIAVRRKDWTHGQLFQQGKVRRAFPKTDPYHRH